MLQLRQIEMFIAVSEELNFKRAADRLNMTQPTISKEIALLEHQLGVKLFARTTRCVKLTVHGSEFYRHAASLLNHAYDVFNKTKLAYAKKNNTFTIGTSKIDHMRILPDILEAFRRENSNLEIKITELNTQTCITQINKGEVDIGLVLLPVHHENLMVQPLLVDSMKLAISKYHPLAKKTGVFLKMSVMHP